MEEIIEGKYIFGTVKLGDRGQIVIPKDARDLFKIKAGDTLLVMGDKKKGIAISKIGRIKEFALGILNGIDNKEELLKKPPEQGNEKKSKTEE
jgi:AbrB family looped-hinge helix DNA binding protein